MTYQLRKTAQGLMLYGSEMEKPKPYGYGYNDHTLPEWYKTFQPICPIHKECEEAFMCYALKLKYNEIYTADAVAKLIEGIEIPSEMVGFDDNYVYEWHKEDRNVRYAILLPEKKEDESQAEQSDAVEFAEWLHYSGWKKVSKWDGIHYWYTETYPRENKSTQELYTLFKDEQLKKK